MEKASKELEFHSKISQQIFQTLEEISDEGEEGSINTRTARKIIRMVHHFNFNRELLLERLRSEMITPREFKNLLSQEGQRCIDEINHIMYESTQVANLR